jgi:hypothetical protein
MIDVTASAATALAGWSNADVALDVGTNPEALVVGIAAGGNNDLQYFATVTVDGQALTYIGQTSMIGRNTYWYELLSPSAMSGSVTARVALSGGFTGNFVCWALHGNGSGISRKARTTNAGAASPLNVTLGDDTARSLGLVVARSDTAGWSPLSGTVEDGDSGGSYFGHESRMRKGSRSFGTNASAASSAQGAIYIEGTPTPGIGNLTYRGESSGNGSFTHSPVSERVATILAYGREEQYSDFSSVQYGGVAMTRHTYQSGGGNIMAASTYAITDFTEASGDLVSWSSGYGNNHKWSLDIEGLEPVTVAAAAKATFGSSTWQANRTVSLNPGKNSEAIIYGRFKEGNDVEIRGYASNGRHIRSLYNGNPGNDRTVMFSVPILEEDGPVDVGIWYDWPLENASVHGLAFAHNSRFNRLSQSIMIGG